MTIEDATLETSEEDIAELLKYKIIKAKGKNIEISFLDQQYEDAQLRMKKASNAGIKSGEKRAINKSTNLELNPNIPLTNLELTFNLNPTDKKRVDKKRLDNTIDDVELVYKGETENSKPTPTTSTQIDLTLTDFTKNPQAYRDAYEAWRTTCKSDKLFIDTYCLKHNAKQSEIIRLIDTFQHHLITTDKAHATISSYKRHFSAYLGIKEKTNEINHIFRANIVSGE